MNRDFNALYETLAPMGLDAAELLQSIARCPALQAQPTRLELSLPGGVECCVSRCGLDEDGRRCFLNPYELADDEVLDIHYLSAGGRVFRFADLWQGPWNAPAAQPAALPAA